MPFSVYFLSGCRAGTTFEYRVLQKQEQLSAYGIHSLARQDLSERGRLLREAAAHDLLYLYRVPYSSLIEALIEQARGRGISVVFDTDDLVFEPDLVHHVDPVRAMSHEDAALYYQGVWRYRRALLASDAVVTATRYLADRARALGKPAFVHRNGLSRDMIAQAAELVQRGSGSARDRVVVGYGSGTATHRKDLAEAAGALAELMARHPQVELHVVGALHPDDPLPLPDALNPFADRVRHRPGVPWPEWLALQHSFDVNLAPLESGNPFCDAKSEIKYTEAALVGVPTVASRTGAFEYAIRDGETGFLAGDPDEWLVKLEALVTDAGLRRRVGEAARADVLARYAPEVLGEGLVETLTAIQALPERESDPPAAPASDETPLILNWIFPEPMPGSGGHTDIVRMMNLLADFGHQVNAYVVPRHRLWDKSDLEVRQFVRRHFADLKGGVFKWAGGALVESDAVVLTHWSTAYLVDDVHNTSQIFYFVQDWEPFFFPMGTEYLRAEQTYKMGFSCITLGRWLTKRMREWYDADADYFDLAVDHTIYYPRPVEPADHPRLCFYARPSTPRRLFPMGIEALQLVHQRRPDVEIIFYGVEEADLRPHPVPFPYTNRGILNEGELAELFSACEVGIVLSPTNCSLVPPEMMACKCAVVDLNRETVMGVLEHEVNALLAEPTPAGIAETALRLLGDEPLRQRLVEAAYQHVQARSWRKSARKVEEIMYCKLPVTRRGRAPHRFHAPPNPPALDRLPPDQQRRLNAVHAARRRLPARAKAAFKAWAKRLLGVDRGVALNGAPVHLLGELSGRDRVGQRFVARRDGLCRIDVLAATYGRRNTRDLIFRLKTSPDAEEDLVTARLNASLLIDQGYVSFGFPPQPESAGKSYYFCLESPESVPGDAITLWAYQQADVPGAALERNGRTSNGQLVFGLFYRDEGVGIVGERPLLYGWGKRVTFWDRLKKGVQVLANQGPRGLGREVLNYWKWKTGRG